MTSSVPKSNIINDSNTSSSAECLTNTSSSPSKLSSHSSPMTCIVIGMAGSGKSTFMKRIVAESNARRKVNYVVNLDPAVPSTSYECNIDIRDTVNYKEVMKTYKLGPNGAIVTSLNLFATRFDQVIDFVENKAEQLDYMFIDTPGQIEVFTWSASGAIITESLAATFPTVIVYVIDTPRCSSPISFMSNMMYACSIMYKTKLPFLIVFNKTDVVSHQFAVDWLRDVDLFEEALRSEQTYMSTLTRSMGFVMEEFYKNINCVGVSALTGEGMDEFFSAVNIAAGEYNDVYRPYLAERIEKRQLRLAKLQKEEVKKAMNDFAEDHEDEHVTHADDEASSSLRRDVGQANTDAALNGDVDASGVPFDNYDYEQERLDYEEFLRDEAARKRKAGETTPLTSISNTSSS